MLRLLLVAILALFMGSITSGCVMVTGATVEGPSKITVKVAVASAAMSAGHTIQTADYKLEDRTLSTCPIDTFRRFDQLAGKKTTKPIAQGQIITSQDIE